MQNESQLIPVFIPPLATLLGAAEQQKGKPLSPTEVEAIRDRGACIMMTPADAQKMAASRGYIDVNPENCWADWHRLRVQVTGHGYLPKIILCIPGDDELRARCAPILESNQIEHEFRPHDENMLRAFKASSTTWPAFTADDFERIKSHTTVLYVLSKNFTAAEAPAIARAFLSAGRGLLDAGGIAIKSDSSGISHPSGRWAGFDEDASRSETSKWSALFHAYVVFPIGATDEFYSCGMHLLGAPDLIISGEVMEQSTNPDETNAAAAVRLFSTFAIYLLAECPIGRFHSGHTFSIERNAPRYQMIWEPCTGFAEDDFFFNPFGRWRFAQT